MTENNLQANEILDVVDMDDKVVGQATRGEIHEKGLIHRAVHVFLFNSMGAIYVQRRSKWKDRYPLKLDSSAAGHVDSGETYNEAARRELQEELSIMADLAAILKVQACPETDNESVVLFEAHSDVPPVPDPEEICDGKFISPGELSELMKNDCDDFVPAFILLWDLYMNTGSS
ncbi:MAG: NUDIX hydrolase [Desulfomonilaceae bacterium]